MVTERGDVCDVRIVDDGELCRGVPRRFVRPRAADDEEEQQLPWERKGKAAGRAKGKAKAKAKGAPKKGAR